MFKDNTVFVVGAGASAEFGLPVGWQLMKTIKDYCDIQLDHSGSPGRPSEIFEHYQRVFGRNDLEKVNEFNKRLKACRQIRDGIEDADSIDEYIYRYSDDPLVAEVGKLQIAYAISAAEEQCSLHNGVKDGKKIETHEKTWVFGFFKALINGVRSNELDQIGNNITIICFNYDRCIEHYLEHSLCRAFHGLQIEEARQIVKRIEIIHPYGSLGELDKFPFGASRQFPQMAENLVTWSETVKDPDTVRDMKKAIRRAKRIVFMGFAFANQNMQLLDAAATETNYNCPRVYTTGFGLPVETNEALGLNINALYSNGFVESELKKIHFQYGAKCKEFFDIHRLNLVQ